MNQRKVVESRPGLAIRAVLKREPAVNLAQTLTHSHSAFCSATSGCDRVCQRRPIGANRVRRIRRAARAMVCSRLWCAWSGRKLALVKPRVRGAIFRQNPGQEVVGAGEILRRLAPALSASCSASLSASFLRHRQIHPDVAHPYSRCCFNASALSFGPSLMAGDADLSRFTGSAARMPLRSWVSAAAVSSRCRPN